MQMKHERKNWVPVSHLHARLHLSDDGRGADQQTLDLRISMPVHFYMSLISLPPPHPHPLPLRPSPPLLPVSNSNFARFLITCDGHVAFQFSVYSHEA